MYICYKRLKVFIALEMGCPDRCFISFTSQCLFSSHYWDLYGKKISKMSIEWVLLVGESRSFCGAYLLPYSHLACFEIHRIQIQYSQ